jgi:hypothetical protein
MSTGDVSLRYKAENLLSTKASVERIYHAKAQYSPESNMNSKFIAYILRDRYMKSIREERGGTYHVGVANELLKYPEGTVQFVIDFDTDPKLVDELLRTPSPSSSWRKGQNHKSVQGKLKIRFRSSHFPMTRHLSKTP